ncbi:zinc ribbon domain-containing protein [Alteromonas stellipolaris]|uniref:zinc ribbon domain-containing protein n=1 Tax=Alteromonas stellipolaris TaxID=233316 RepID=UPI002117FE57|nr:zinc ribbon domain-containing protein [Alteromonas stellipolaris]MCQ8849810.1 zinc ribbon domain-containing protein [Alteromonas stellipolaris]
MALISCPECKQQVSEKSQNCIHCGYPIGEYLSNPENHFDIPTYSTDFALTGLVSRGLLYGPALTCYYLHELNKDLLFDEGKITLQVFENGISCYASLLQRKQIHYSQIVDLQIEEVNSYSNKDKSVLGRAVVGGILLGGVGAIVGGLSGQGKKSMRFNRVISIIYHENKRFHQIILPFLVNKDDNHYLSTVLIEKYKEFINLDDDVSMVDREPNHSKASEQIEKENGKYAIIIFAVFLILYIVGQR